MVVGLGNPGREYEGTPHNSGFDVVLKLADSIGCSFKRSWRFKARTAKSILDETGLFLVQPLTYMNNSGDAVAALLRYWRLGPDGLIVVLDDADLELGRLRIREKGSSGGHKGLASIIGAVGSEDFVRVRVGVGRSRNSEDLIGHVLKPFSGREADIMAGAIENAVESVKCIIIRGPAEAMNIFNGPVADGNKNAEPAGR